MHRIKIVACLALFSLWPVATIAETDHAGTNRTLTAMLLAQSDSPITLTACKAYVGAGFNAAGGGVTRAFAYEGVRIRNVSTKTAAAIRFRFDFFDTFDGELKDANQLSSIEGTYSPNVDVDLMSQTLHAGFMARRFKDQPTFINPNPAGDGTDRVLCSIDSVKFADGTVWHADYSRERKLAAGHFVQSP